MKLLHSTLSGKKGGSLNSRYPQESNKGHYDSVGYTLHSDLIFLDGSAVMIPSSHFTELKRAWNHEVTFELFMSGLDYEGKRWR
jgi:hypothetical protein